MLSLRLVSASAHCLRLFAARSCRGFADTSDGYKAREIANTVNSLRLDAVVRAGFGITRNQAEIDIMMGQCFVNGQQTRVKNKQLKVGDVILIRSGMRKAELTLVSADTTKKDRIKLNILRTPIQLTDAEKSNPPKL